MAEMEGRTACTGTGLSQLWVQLPLVAGIRPSCEKSSTLPGVQALVHNCLFIKGLGVSIRVYATGHIKDSMSLVEKSRALCPDGRFPSSFIYQKSSPQDWISYDSMFSPWWWPQIPTGRKTSTQSINQNRFKLSTKVIKTESVIASALWLISKLSPKPQAGL